MDKTTEAPQTTQKAHTLKSLALGIEKGSVNLSEAKEGILAISESDSGFTKVYFDTENPNKMIFKGNPDNALLTLDRMDSDRTIDRQTWRSMRDIINDLRSQDSIVIK